MDRIYKTATDFALLDALYVHRDEIIAACGFAAALIAIVVLF